MVRIIHRARRGLALVAWFLFAAAAPAFADTIYITRAGISTNEVDTVGPGGSLNFFAAVAAPEALVFDKSGNLYVGSASQSIGQSTIDKITAAGVVTTYATGLTGPTALAFDSLGNLYATNETLDTISKITPGGVVSTFAHIDGEGEGLAFDTSGNLFVSTLDGTVQEVTPGGVVSTFAVTHQSFGSGLAIDASNNLYMANDGNTINKITPGGVVSVFGTGTNQAAGLAFDSAGNLYAADAQFPGALDVFSPAGVRTTVASNVNNIQDVALKPAAAVTPLPPPVTGGLALLALVATASWLRRPPGAAATAPGTRRPAVPWPGRGCSRDPAN